MGNWSGSAWPILVNAALKSTLVLGAAWLVAFLLRGRSAAARHVAWTAAAAAVLALPFLSVSLPILRLPVRDGVVPADSGLTFRVDSTAVAAPGAQSSPPHTSGKAPAVPVRAWQPDWKFGLVLLWAAGVAIALARLLAAYLAVWRVRRRAQSFPDAEIGEALAQTFAISHPVRVLKTAEGSMPMTFGILHPTIFLPACAARWTEERRRLVLLHELAHVRRGDAATHLLARIALSLNWWNPLAWAAWRKFLQESERAADDLVLNTGARASDYAGHLLEVARTMRLEQATAWAALAMARPSQLEGRLLAILDSGVNRRTPGRAAAIVAAVLAIAAIAPLAALRAQAQAQTDRAIPADISAPRFRTATQQAQTDRTTPADIDATVDATIRTANAQKNYEMLEQAASAFEKLRKLAEAQALREAALALTEQVAGQQSAPYAEGLVKLGDLARQRGQYAESLAYYTKAAALGDRPEIVPALEALWLKSYRERDVAGALEYLQRARNLAKTGNDIGKSMTWIAFIKQNMEGGASEAESLYTAAISLEDANSPAQALTMDFYARFLRSQDRTPEAEQFETRSKVIRKAQIQAMSATLGGAGQAYRVGGGVSAPSLLFKIEPAYSEEARAAKIAGPVLLTVVIGVDGRATEMVVTQGLGFGLDEQAVKAVGQWLFKPGAKDGVPVPVQAQIEVNWRLM
jgi:TonB family protein